MPTRSWLILGAALLLASCRVRADSLGFSESTLSPLPADHPVRLYRNSLPACSFEEIGLVSASGGSLRKMGEALRRKARQMGGSAIVGLNLGQQASSGSTQVQTAVPDSGSVVTTATFSISNVDVLTGTVVRFLDPECQR